MTVAQRIAILILQTVEKLAAEDDEKEEACAKIQQIASDVQEFLDEKFTDKRQRMLYARAVRQLNDRPANLNEQEQAVLRKLKESLPVGD